MANASKSAKTTDGITITLESDGLTNRATYEHRGTLTPEQAAAVFAQIPTLAYADIPAAIKRAKKAHPAKKEAPHG